MKKLFFFICTFFISLLSNGQAKKAVSKSTPKKIDIEKTTQDKVDPCKSISYGYKVDSSNTFYTTTETIEKVQVIRNVKGVDTSYYAYFKVPGSIILEKPKGVYAIINSYRRIIEPNISLSLDANKKKIQSDDPYLYTAFVRISELEFLSIAIDGLIGFKLDIFETSLTEKENDILKAATMCIWKNNVTIDNK